MKQQLADIATLGDEEEREELQDMITEVMMHDGAEHAEVPMTGFTCMVEPSMSPLFLSIL